VIGRAAGELPSELSGGEIAVVGLARSGRAVARALRARGVTVYASDSARNDETEAAEAELARLGAAVDLGTHDLPRIAQASLVVASPGIPPSAPPLMAARAGGGTVVSEVEVALKLHPGLRYVAVTGSNGKTTTTAMIAELLGALGLGAAVAGNIGTPLIELIEAPPEWVALELSSFQLHDTPSIRPAVGVLTNLSANHLDRYESLERYYADKALLFRNAAPGSQWVLNGDDPAVLDLAAGAAGHHHHFSLRSSEAEARLGGDVLMVFGRRVLPRVELQLAGDHNVANALAAAMATLIAVGRQDSEALAIVGRALAGFAPLEHRIEPVSEILGVLWVNDSKSTSVGSTLVALRGMQRPTVLLLGGRHKGEPYTGLASEVSRIVRAVVAYGEARDEIVRDLGTLVHVEPVEPDFAAVMDGARSLAHPGDVVLLSPACSSYDMFRNYEERGAEFKRLVRTLAQAGEPRA
jgi:UDP-N-acetylmuramoylalanine--D-glutamate ligase